MFRVHEICCTKLWPIINKNKGILFNTIVHQKKTVYDVFEILKTTYGDATLSRATVYRWYAAFSCGKLKGGPGATYEVDRQNDENCYCHYARQNTNDGKRFSKYPTDRGRQRSSFIDRNSRFIER